MAKGEVDDGQTGHNMQQLLVCCCNMGHLLSLQHASEDDQTTENIQMMQNLLVNVKQTFFAHYSFTKQPLCILYIYICYYAFVIVVPLNT